MDESKNTASESLDQLVRELGIDTLPEDKRNDLLIKMTEVLLKRIFLETMEKLGEQGRDEYEEIMQKNPQPEELEAFFAEKIKDYEDMVKGIVADFKKEMLTIK